MSRQGKNTVDYIPLDCQFSDSIQAVENLYGNDGFVVWVKLLQKLGRTENYIIDVRTSLQWSLFYTLFRLPESRLIEIINLLADLDCIQKELWKKKLIYSPNLVKRISNVYQKRKYDLQPINDILFNMGISDDGNIKKDDGNIKKDDGNKQSKVKESKVKESEEEEEEGKISTSSTSDISDLNKERIEDLKNFYGEYKNVHLTSKQLDALKTMILNDSLLNELIQELSENIEQGKEKIFDEKRPGIHFVRLKKYWQYRQNIAIENNKKEEDSYNYGIG